MAKPKSKKCGERGSGKLLKDKKYACNDNKGERLEPQPGVRVRNTKRAGISKKSTCKRRRANESSNQGLAHARWRAEGLKREILYARPLRRDFVPTAGKRPGDDSYAETAMKCGHQGSGNTQGLGTAIREMEGTDQGGG